MLHLVRKLRCVRIARCSMHCSELDMSERINVVLDLRLWSCQVSALLMLFVPPQRRKRWKGRAMRGNIGPRFLQPFVQRLDASCFVRITMGNTSHELDWYRKLNWLIRDPYMQQKLGACNRGQGKLSCLEMHAAWNVRILSYLADPLAIPIPGSFSLLWSRSD